jgi:Winged helix-turn helix
LWTRRIVANLIKDKYGLALSVTAVGLVLAKLDIAPRKPLRRARGRDPAAIEQWNAWMVRNFCARVKPCLITHRPRLSQKVEDMKLSNTLRKR